MERRCFHSNDTVTAADGEKSEEERRNKNRENRGEDKQNNTVKEDKPDVFVFVTGKFSFNPHFFWGLFWFFGGFFTVLTSRMWKRFCNLAIA